MTDTAMTAEELAEERQAKRNAILLAVAAAIGGGVGPINIAVGGLTGVYLLAEDKSLATLPVSMFLVGVAAGAIPAAQIMRRVGRKRGFIGGTFAAMAGGIIAGLSVIAGSFVAFTLGMLVAGFSMSFIQQYRFAAADSGSPAFRAQAISWVLAGGIVAAIVGPQTAIIGSDLLSVPFAGAYFGMTVLAFLGMIVLLFLGGSSSMPEPRAVGSDTGRSFRELFAIPRFTVSLVCAIGAYSLMSLLMTAAPLAMIASNHSHANSALGIQWHVLAMFLPSYVTGKLIARFGAEVIIAIGLALLAVSALVALGGIDLMNFWLALIVLGVGWNFGFIGATAMLTSTYRPEEKSKVQGLNDFLVFGTVAAASLLSGRLFVTVGWNWINLVALPIAAACMLLLAIVVLHQRRASA